MTAQKTSRGIDELSTGEVYRRADIASDPNSYLVLDALQGYEHEFVTDGVDAYGRAAVDSFVPAGPGARVLAAYASAEKIAQVRHHPAREQWVAMLTSGKPVNPVFMARKLFGIGVSAAVLDADRLTAATPGPHATWMDAAAAKA